MAKSSVADFFDSYAHDFDAIYGTRHTALNRLVNKHLRKSMRLRYEKSIAGCDPIEGRSVLDIGCGPGHFGIALASRGARRVVGIDFAPQMLTVAQQHAKQKGIADRCEWVLGDFLSHSFSEKFDYAIICGVMDYIAKPGAMIDKVLSVITGKAFFSFPVGNGLLAWQRKLRYKKRCDLFLYSQSQVKELFSNRQVDLTIEQIARDFFVTVARRQS
ncbi:MAG TPA: methyltransferase domain-containing protein [Pirellulales bacterium]|jgi:2-polyprenyl-3-methyl-5-hydroxy-6-metoxy-1,4-benzoquinol methylase|nr:methyltransferase domain-containing protein [Pirellulales bacterium]